MGFCKYAVSMEYSQNVCCQVRGLQQNGVAERGNRTILEMAQSMLLGACLPKKFWGHAMMHACCINEYLSTANGSSDSSHSIWCGQQDNPDFKVFGSKVTFVHNED